MVNRCQAQRIKEVGIGDPDLSQESQNEALCFLGGFEGRRVVAPQIGELALGDVVSAPACAAILIAPHLRKHSLDFESIPIKGRRRSRFSLQVKASLTN